MPHVSNASAVLGPCVSSSSTKQTFLTSNHSSPTPVPPHRPRNANELLILCNLLVFPLNPGFKQGCARRRSHQCIHRAGQSQSYCEPEVERLHSQQELHLYKEPASSAPAGAATSNEPGSLQQRICPGCGQAGAAPTLSLPFPACTEGTEGPPSPPHTPLPSSPHPTETGNTM